MNTDEENSKKDPVTGAILAAAFEVSNTLGHAFAEKVYHRALVWELTSRGYRVETERKLDVYYKGQLVGEFFADLIVENRVLVEIKSLPALVPAHTAQVINYLRATGLRVALLLNFGTGKVDYHRIVL